ncbi:ABC transporter ATP-binding protein [candidate division KSB1 bacterium]
MAYLEVDKISKSFGEVKAAQNISMTVDGGAIYGLLGPNGAGKTTTIRMIMSIIMPDEGSVKILGKERDYYATDHIGYLPEERGLYRKMKVGETLQFLASIKSLRGSKVKGVIDTWLERMGLAEWKNKKVEELSKGMQQKIQFIATIIHDPDIIILDEPFAGLDPINVNLLKDIILELKNKGKAIVFSTHMMESAEKLCDHIYLVNKGTLIVNGKLRDVKGEYGRDSVLIEFKGDDSFLKTSPEIRSFNQYENVAEIRLNKGADSQKLLQTVMKNAEIYRFECTEPSLNAIFIEKVKYSNSN